MKQTFTFHQKRIIIARAEDNDRDVFLQWFKSEYPASSEATVSEKQLAIWKIKVRAARRTNRMGLRSLRNMHHTEEEIKELENLIANFPYVNKAPALLSKTIEPRLINPDTFTASLSDINPTPVNKHPYLIAVCVVITAVTTFLLMR